MAEPAADQPAQPFDAVILAGGRAERLGGADKPGLRIGGRTLVGAVVSAATAAGADAVIVVGPARPGLPRGGRVRFTSERPPAGGPVPALRAGLALVTRPWLLLLAADLPFLRAWQLRELVSAATVSGAAVLADDAGVPQWLTSCWRADDLRAGLDRYGGEALSGVLRPLRPAVVAIPAGDGPPPWLDCDTPDDLVVASRWAIRAGGRGLDEHDRRLDLGG
jgi:molybdenum cofactor guanylyltransferase